MSGSLPKASDEEILGAIRALNKNQEPGAFNILSICEPVRNYCQHLGRRAINQMIQHVWKQPACNAFRGKSGRPSKSSD